MQKSTNSLLGMGKWYEIIDEIKRNCVLLKVLKSFHLDLPTQYLEFFMAVGDYVFYEMKI